MLQNKNKLLEELKIKAIPLLKPYARKVSVFGSVVRGDADTGSDIDLLVELKPTDQRPRLGFGWFGLENEIGRLMGKKVDLVSEKEVSPHLRVFIDRNKVLLYEEN